MKGAKDKIPKIAGKPVIAIAYPYGKYNDKVLTETKEYYEFGLTTITELYSKKTGGRRTLSLPRLYVKYSTTIDEFEKIIKGR